MSRFMPTKRAWTIIPVAVWSITELMLWSYDHPWFLVCLAVGGIGGLMLTRGGDDD